MMVAVAADGGAVAQHFGQCEGFVVCEIADGVVGPRRVVASEPHAHGQCSGPELLARQGVTHLIVGGMGQGAVHACAAFGIETLRGVDMGIDEALAALATGKLVSRPVPCSQGGGGGSCGH